MSFENLIRPAMFYDGTQTDRTLDGYVAQIFSGAAGPAAPIPATDARRAPILRVPRSYGSERRIGAGAEMESSPTVMGGSLHALINGEWPAIANATSSIRAAHQ